MRFGADTDNDAGVAADALLRGEGIRCPERWVRMLVATL
jgi:hypothetical protein